MDIHVLKGSKSNGIGTYHVAFHIPITSPKPAITFPNTVSEVDGISQEELDLIKAGTLIETVQSVKCSSGVDANTYKIWLKIAWQELKQELNAKYDYEYAFYGVAFNVVD